MRRKHPDNLAYIDQNNHYIPQYKNRYTPCSHHCNFHNNHPNNHNRIQTYNH